MKRGLIVLLVCLALVSGSAVLAGAAVTQAEPEKPNIVYVVDSADADGDGLANNEDDCDALANLAKTNGGCPFPQGEDYDHDGIVDSEDDITGREAADPNFGVPTNSRVKAHCEVHATNRADPIAFTQHLHRQVGNTTTSDESTGQSLFGAGGTSCDAPWLTSALWFPVEADGDNPDATHMAIRGVNLYYRGHDDERLVQDIPVGLQLLSPRQMYNCGGDGSFQDAPPYGCSGNGWSTRSIFPDCIDPRRLTEESVNAVESDNISRCPASHPYRIPEVNHFIAHENPIPNPLVVSTGVDQWGEWDLMHGDYFAALQPEFNRNVDKNGDGQIQESTEESLIQYCIREGRGDSNGPARCGTENT